MTNDPSNQEPEDGIQPEEVSKSEFIRDLIMGPERKEMETQFKGMKELFTSMLTENKKEYDRQLGEMKHVFSQILLDNRQAFQAQLQDLLQALPKMVNNSLHSGQEEHFIYLSELTRQQEAEKRKEVEKLTRVDALKEIIGGGDIRGLHERVQVLRKIEDEHTQLEQALTETMTNLFTARIVAMEEKVSKRVNEACHNISDWLRAHEETQAKRQLVGQALAEAGGKIKA